MGITEDLAAIKSMALEAMEERTKLLAINAELVADNKALREALEECITDDGAVCFEHREYMERRIRSCTATARAALAKAKGAA